MSKRKRYAPGVGFKLALEEAMAKAVPGTVTFTEVYHDLWCHGGSAVACTCKPDIVLRAVPRPKDN